jgi:hypothetical protein
MGQSTRMNLDIERPAVARPKRKGSGGRSIGIVVAVALCIAMFVYGPTHLGRIQRAFTDKGESTAAGGPAGAEVSGKRLASAGAGRDAILEVMSQGWEMLPAEERRVICTEAANRGVDQAAADLGARLLGDGATAGVVGPELPVQFLTIACAEVAAGG